MRNFYVVISSVVINRSFRNEVDEAVGGHKKLMHVARGHKWPPSAVLTWQARLIFGPSINKEWCRWH